MKLEGNISPCIIAGCIYAALITMRRPIGHHQAKVRVCRKCATELKSVYNWSYVHDSN